MPHRSPRSSTAGKQQHLSKRRHLLRALGAGLLLAAWFLALMFYKDLSYHASDPVEPPQQEAQVLVVYFSRSGHTEAASRQIARQLNADIVQLRAPAYAQTYSGFRRASKDAKAKVSAPISPQRLDLSKYRLVVLGSPIWWYRPAPPLWAFAEANEFRGAAVVLFNTFNSRFKREEIDAFRALVERQGGRFLDHIYVRRGRIYWQLSGAEVLRQVEIQVAEKSPGWLSVHYGEGR